MTVANAANSEVVAPFIPRLRVDGAEQPVRLKTLDVRIDIQGGFAEVTLDMIFFNPNRRVLEGELQFPLLPGQEVSGLALDIDGELRSAVPVGKTRGREVFEEVVRNAADPALLEATQGNSYRLRLYPIPARGTRRVAVRFLQPLTEKNGNYFLRLPLAFAKRLDRFRVEALVVAGKPPVVEADNLGLVLEQSGHFYRGVVEKEGISPEGWLAIGLPAAAMDLGRNIVRWQDEIYFMATASTPVRREKRELPNLVTIVWDASGSGEKRDHVREYELLDAYFAAFGEGRARLVVVRDAAENAGEFAIRGGDWRELKSALRQMVYDGGTNLASWKPTVDCGEYLLFTDGLDNLRSAQEERALPTLSSGQRLYSIVSSLTANHIILRQASDNRLIDLLQTDAARAASLLLEDRTAMRIVSETLPGNGDALLDPASIVLDDTGNAARCRVVGWFKARDGVDEARITIELTHPDGTRESVPIALPLAECVRQNDADVPLTARVWGRCAMTELEANERGNRAAIERLGRKFGIVGKQTSLIVLETAEDYARHDIEPPESLRAQVERLIARGGSRSEPSYVRMETLEKWWTEKVAWWNRNFPEESPKPKAVIDDATSEDSFGEERSYLSHRRNQAGFEGASRRVAGLGLSQGWRNSMQASVSPVAPERRQVETDASTDSKPINVALLPWRADAPYIARMKNASKNEMYAVYLDERPDYQDSSAFYFDMADRFFAEGMPELGVRILSNLAEMELESSRLLRILGYRLLEAGEYELAVGVLERVRDIVPHEPQSVRDLAVAHQHLGNVQQAADLLYEVARRKWDDRFDEINTIALTELNALVATATEHVDVAAFDGRLLKNIPSDVRIILSWDTDNTDIDLWVTHPNGEKCYYRNALSSQGGRMSRDCVAGYGPEEFMLKHAMPGTYRVEANYFGGAQQIISGDVTLNVVIATHFGTERHKEKTITVRLKERRDTILVGEFTVPGKIGK